MTMGKLDYKRETYDKMGRDIEAFYSANTEAIKTGVREAVSAFIGENTLGSHDIDTDDSMLYVAHRLALHLGCKIHAIIDGWKCAGEADEVNTTKTVMKNGINTMLLFCIYVYFLLKRFGPNQSSINSHYRRALIYGMRILSLRNIPSQDDPHSDARYLYLSWLLLLRKNIIIKHVELDKLPHDNSTHTNDPTSDIIPNPKNNHLRCPASYTKGGMDFVNLLGGAFLDGMNQKFPIS